MLPQTQWGVENQIGPPELMVTASQRPHTVAELCLALRREPEVQGLPIGFERVGMVIVQADLKGASGAILQTEGHR